MRPPQHVKQYVHNAIVPRAYQLSFLLKGAAPNCCGFYTYLMYVTEGPDPMPKTQERVKGHLRIIRRVNPL